MTDGTGMAWLRRFTEVALIVASVFLAVFLEGAADERAERAAARVALSQLLGELRDDLVDFDRIIAIQSARDQDYRDMLRWLGDDGRYPADSVGGAILRITADNSTLFPRHASWTTMVSADQLTALDAPELVLQLGQLYESVYPRIEYNGRYYDENLLAMVPSPTVVRWQSLNARPLTDDAAAIATFASTLEFIHVGWNLWYRDLLVDYRAEVSAAIVTVEAYLEREGVTGP